MLRSSPHADEGITRSYCPRKQGRNQPEITFRPIQASNSLTRAKLRGSLEYMEPSAEIYLPSRLYAKGGWFGLGGAVICAACGIRAPFAFIPAFLCGVTSVLLFWLSARPRISVGETQFSLGERSVAWREVREINSTRLVSPLLLRVKLTNSRKCLIVFPGQPERISKLRYQLRRNATLATFDGVSYKDYWTWSSMGMLQGNDPAADQPVRMISQDDEEEIERLYRQLKSVGRLDSHSDSDKS